MKMLVTGAAGFVGGFLIHELLRREHRVIALVRSAVPECWLQFENLEIMRADLRQRATLDFKEKGIEVILHLAAATQGSVAKQFEDTVTGTGNLLAAARDAHISRIIGISSMAVLDYSSLPSLTVIDETVATADDAGAGDYAAAKIRQERLLLDFARDAGNRCTILRPGLVYDQTRMTAGHAGIVRSHVGLLASHRGEVPTVEARGLAAAIASAAEKNFDGAEVIHLVDDDLPTQSAYIGALRRRSLLPTTTLVIPWRVLQVALWLAAIVLRLTGFKGRMPEVVLPSAFSTRLKPFRFSNAKAKRLLGWTPGRQFA